MNEFKVVCINDKNIPAEIPAELRVEAHEMYTVSGVERMFWQPGKIGLKLKELPFPEGFKYSSWISERFRPATEDDYLALEAVAELLQEVEEMDLVPL